MDSNSLGIIHILPEAMCEQMQLRTKREQRPVLRLEVCEERFALAHVADVCYPKAVQVIIGVVCGRVVHFHGLGGACLLLRFLVLTLAGRVRVRVRVRGLRVRVRA